MFHCICICLSPIKVSLLFEVEDLAVASPATVSRCGMVYNDWKDLGWEPYVKSWLSNRKDGKVQLVHGILIEQYVCRAQLYLYRNRWNHCRRCLINM